MDNIQPVIHIRVSDCDFNLYISYVVSTGNIHMFKYNGTRCDYEVFDNEHDAKAWVQKPIRSAMDLGDNY